MKTATYLTIPLSSIKQLVSHKLQAHFCDFSVCTKAIEENKHMNVSGICFLGAEVEHMYCLFLSVCGYAIFFLFVFGQAYDTCNDHIYYYLLLSLLCSEIGSLYV